MRSKSFENKTAFFYILLILISFLPYIPLFNADFVHWDDDVYVVDNARVKKGITIENIKWAFTTTYFGFYYPLTWLSHMLDCSLFGLNAKMHHLTSIVWHLLNTLLLFWLFKSATGENVKSFILSSLFAVHPLNVESVAWISERKNLLSAFFFFLGLNLYLSYVRNINFKNYFFMYLSYILGMVAKPILLTFPFAIFLLDIWPLNRIKINNDLLAKSKPLILEKLWFFIPAPIFAYLTVIAQKEADALASLSYIPLKDRIAGAIIAYKDYLLNFFLPLKLTALYPHLKNNYSVLEVLLSAFFLLFLFFACLKMAKKQPLYLAGFLWFIINLIPVIGIVQVVEQARADRYMYIPMMGILMVVVFGLDKIDVFKFSKKALFVFYLIALSAFGIKSFYQAKTWQNTETLFLNMINVSPNASHAYHNIAIICKERGDIENAIRNYEKAIDIEPCKAKSLNNLGSIYAERGDLEKAAKYFQKAIDCNPKLSQGYYNLGLLYESVGKLDKAITYYQKTIELNPEKGNAYNNLGICYLKKNDFDKAKMFFEKALLLSPDNPQIIFNNALANEQLGNHELAKELYENVLKKDKKHILSRKKLIMLLIKESKLDEALKFIEDGLLLYPQDEELINFKEKISKNDKHRKN